MKRSITYEDNKKYHFIRWLTDIGNKDIGLVGGKGAHLGELQALGIPVPPAFCITTEAFDYFIEKNKLGAKISNVMSKLNVDNLAQLREMTWKVRQLVLSHRVPKQIGKAVLEAYHALGKNRNQPWVAVRSSATAEDLPEASFAGQMVTYLNVRGDKDLLEAVQSCWSALFTERVALYRDKHGIKHADVSMGVIIQEMVEADKSGVTFTIHPVTKDRSKIVIEATLGLGQLLVSGSITPDTFVVDKKTLEVLEECTGSKEVMVVRGPEGGTINIDTPMEQRSKVSLTTEEVQRVAEFGRRIERHYDSPQDVEWTISKGSIYILQTRPVTAL